MGRKFAVIVAVEAYPSPVFTTAPFARNDAAAVGAALEAVGVHRADQRVLLDGDATKGRILSALRDCAHAAQDADTIYGYFAAHGFSEARANYIACHDTHPRDAAATALSLQDLAGALGQARATERVLFLDCARGDANAMTALQLYDLFQEGKGMACLSSAAPEEESHTSKALGRGIWSQVLGEALAGNAPEAFDADGELTTRSLQAFLESQVPLVLRQHRNELLVQTPMIYAPEGESIVLVHEDALQRDGDGLASVPVPTLKKLIIRSEEHIGVKLLSGFRPTFRIPTDVNPAAESFVAGLAAGDLEAMFNEMIQRLRKELGYKRRQIQSSIADGSALIYTRDFSFELSMALDPENPARVILRRELINLVDPALIANDAFNRCFAATFDTIEFCYDEAFDIENLVDTLEEKDDHRVTLEYPHDLQYCLVRIARMPFTIRVTARTLRLEFEERAAPRELIDTLKDVRGFLFKEHGISLMHDA